MSNNNRKRVQNSDKPKRPDNDEYMQMLNSYKDQL